VRDFIHDPGVDRYLAAGWLRILYRNLSNQHFWRDTQRGSQALYFRRARKPASFKSTQGVAGDPRSARNSKLCEPRY
jgi:hypothetical protein